MSTAVLRDVSAALIAVFLVATVCLAALYDIVNSKPVSIPIELYAPTTLVIGYFFGAHAATNGALAGTHAVVDAANKITEANAAVPKPLP